jgi:hypothetical protein
LFTKSDLNVVEEEKTIAETPRFKKDNDDQTKTIIETTKSHFSLMNKINNPFYQNINNSKLKIGQ